MPFELFVLTATIPAFRNDPDQSVEELSAVMRAAKKELWATPDSSNARGLWRARVDSVGALLSAVLTQIKVSDHPEPLAGS